MTQMRHSILLALITFVLNLCLLTNAFTTLHHPSITTQTTAIHDRFGVVTFHEKEREPLLVDRITLHASNNHYNYNDDNNDDDKVDLKQEWNALRTAAGHIVRDLGGKALQAAKHVASTVTDVVKEGAHKLQHFLAPAAEPDTSRRRDSNALIVDTQDEDLFRSIFGEGLFVSTADMMESSSVDRVVDQAVTLLRNDDIATTLLGPNLRCHRPFSQNQQTTTINGQTTTTVRARFEVFGSQGAGIASVMSNNGKVVSLDLEVDGRLYRYNTSTSSFNNNNNNNNNNNVYQRKQPEPAVAEPTRPPSNKKDFFNFYNNVVNDAEEVGIDVEVMEGIRRPRASRTGGIMDAEIEGKTFL